MLKLFLVKAQNICNYRKPEVDIHVYKSTVGEFNKNDTGVNLARTDPLMNTSLGFSIILSMGNT